LPVVLIRVLVKGMRDKGKGMDFQTIDVDKTRLQFSIMYVLFKNEAGTRGRIRRRGKLHALVVVQVQETYTGRKNRKIGGDKEAPN